MKLHSKNLIWLVRNIVGTPKVGVEIGVYRGQNSEELLAAFPSLYLYLVDLWKEWSVGDPYYETRHMGKQTQEQWNAVYDEARTRIEKFRDRAQILQEESVVASSRFGQGELDFVFIDADHSYEAVKKDIQSWLPKIRKGGLISGHDYGKSYGGVPKATNELLGKENLILRAGLIWGCVVT